MQYFYEEGQKIGSPFIIDELNPIQMPNMDMDELFAGRRQFTEAQWIDEDFSLFAMLTRFRRLRAWRGR